MLPRKVRFWSVLLGMLLLVACSATAAAPEMGEENVVAPTTAAETTTASESWGTQAVANVTVPDGFEIGLVVQGLSGPTQMIKGPDGDLWIAQLGGAEGGGTGSVVAISPDGSQRTLLENLLNPTGIAVVDKHLWLALGRDIARAPIQEDYSVGAVETILKDLPFNQRTNGTLTVTPDGLVLFVTSGRPAVEQGDYSDSGILWTLDPTNPTKPAEKVATGLKNAYAHIYDAQGQLWASEVSDDVVDGVAAPDEINRIAAGGNYGWPECYGDRVAAESLGGTTELCAATQPPSILFPPHTTPTSLVSSPWQTDTFFVALWLAGEVVQVAVHKEGQAVESTMVSFVEGLRRPQHLLVWGENELLVSDFGTGAVFLIQATTQ